MKNLIRIVAMVGVVCAAMTMRAQAPPHILLDTNDFARLNAMAKAQPWAAKQRQAILDEADAFPQSYEKRFGLTTMELPPEGGQWLHYYACPDTGSQLVFHPPDENVCPDTGQVFKGYPYDHCVYQLRADFLEHAAITEALAFRLTGKREYADKAAEILKKYADKYLTYAMHDNYGKESQNAARVYSQTLDEAIWLIDLAWTYDLLRDTDEFTAAERTHIERDLLYASAMTVTRSNMGQTDNIQSWILGAETAVGFALDDKALLDKALNGVNGFRQQMKEFVNDGFWIEGSWGYQFYALRPLEFIAQMWKRAGVDLWQQEPNLGRMLDSPLGVMFPDGTLPAFNDSPVVDLYSMRARYEIGYAALHKPEYAGVVAKAGRNTREAFLFGADAVSGEMPRLQSTVFPEAGYATLRAPKGDLTEIIKFGPHGGGHGHYDKLGEIIYADGMTMSVDPGTHYYGLPIHGAWDQKTVAHNTVSVDEALQKAATGKLIAWEAAPEFTAVTMDAGPVYDGVDIQRTSILTSEYVVEITTAKSTDGKAHDFDWNYHNAGVQTAEGNFAAYAGFPQRDGYQVLTDNRMAQVNGDVRTSFAMAGGKMMRVQMLGAGTSEVITGDGPGMDLRTKVPYVIVRRHGTEARFVVLLQPGLFRGGAATLREVGGKLIVSGNGWTDTIVPGETVTVERK